MSSEDAPSGSDPSIGDIAYYAPWGNLAIYYKDFAYSEGLVILGKIDGGTDAFNRSEPMTVTVELMKNSSGDGTDTIEISRNGSRTTTNGLAENFTGAVRIEPLFSAKEPSRGAGASVTFEPGARTVWHTHPAGQTLIVTAGTGRVQQWGGKIEEIRTGDVVRIPPGKKHWHGAGPTTAMTHIAIQEAVDGKVVEWMEKVSDEQYNGNTP